MVIEDILYFLLQYGVLVFFLIFAVLFAILQKLKIFGDNKKINIVISLVIGLLVVAPHVLGLYPYEQDVVRIINEAIPNTVGVIVAIVMALLLIGVMGARFELGEGNGVSGWIAIIAFGIVLYIFGVAANWWYAPDWLYWLNDYTIAVIITILIFGLIIWFIVKEDDEGPSDTNLGKEVSKLLKK